MPKIDVEGGMAVNCEIDDYLWPWMQPTPVVMLHGFGRNASFLRRCVPAVSASRRVYRPEVRGCGKSDVPPPGFPLDAGMIVRDMLRVMDAQGLERVHWFGESSGGVLGVLL